MGLSHYCMGIERDFKDILKPTFLGITVFVSLSLLFMASYVLIEYQRYLLAYQATQQLELKTLQQKTKGVVETLKQLSQLTSARITVSGGDIERIQNILGSVPRLNPNHTLPEIQKVSYDKLSRPQMVVTLFGTFPLHPQQGPLNPSSEKATSITFDKDAVISKTTVFCEDNNLEGILEIQIDPSDFKASLGNMTTAAFDSPQSSHDEENQLLQNTPLSIYAKAPHEFWDFAFINQSRYVFFYLYMFACVILIVICAYYLNVRTKNVHKARRDELEANLLKVSTEEKRLKEEFLISQQDSKSHQTSCESYMEYYASLRKRQKEQADYIVRSLSVVEQSLKNPMSQLPEADRVEIIGSCLKATHLLSNGLVSKMKNESIDIRKLLEEIKLLFAEKIYKSKITIDLACLRNLNFRGDPLFIKFILINMIGKSIHGVSKNGSISITTKEKTDPLELEVRDNGYSLADTTERLMEKYSALFVTEDLFHQLCQDNGLEYTTSRAENGFNITTIMIPSTSSEALSSNVIQLFPS